MTSSIQPDDLYQFQWTGQPQLSPDGRYVVYVVTVADKTNNGYDSSLYLQDLQTREYNKLTNFYRSDENVKESSPIWSNDGKSIYFLSNRTGKAQVWCISSNWGEAQQVTDYKHDISEFSLSPDGNHIVCEVELPEDAKDHEDEDENDTQNDVTVIHRLRYLANGKGFISGYSHLFLYNQDTKKTERITSGNSDHTSPIFSHDGQTIYYLKSRNDPKKNGYYDDLYKLDIENHKETLIYQAKGDLFAPTPSPDGRWLAFCGHEDGEVSPENNQVWVISTDGDGKAISLTKHWDHPVGNYVGADSSLDAGNSPIQWDNNSQTIYFMATVGGNCCIKSVTTDGAVEDTSIKGDFVVTSFHHRHQHIVYNKATATEPCELWINEDAGSRPLAKHNDWLQHKVVNTPEPITFKGADEWDIEGWVLLPDSAVKKDRIPVVLEIHGGPHTAYGNMFHHEFQYLAAKGYAVVYTNPRGSQGYGRKFTAACQGDWGQNDRLDILAGLDAALETFPQLDPNNLYVTGGSYGGFMTNMIVTQTNRFTAAVTQRCLSNLYSFYGTSDIGYFFSYRQLGNADFWDDEETVLKFSPIRYARNVDTPMNIIHSEEDYRCPMEQAEQWYVALTRLGVETRFVRFQGENHELSRAGKPENRITRLQEISDWFDRYNQ
ncbi:S9 family peptidase [Tuberibacillus sp. Marseille-P3662]|uniref:S9 family peptidase n=1 Tax=Tuberibacillus sp. Marseille-P3662 TaxID=1965358 RepID=UPI001593BCD5|nr:S9 family peptidase [Tuberibacillus sp. Marseille-P3662]